MNLITQLQGNRSIVLIKLLFLLFFTLSTQVGIAQNQKISLSGK